MINVNICNKIHNSRIAIIALLMLIFILTSSSVLSATDPFTITEHTKYGLTENVVYITVTENLGKDQNIDISHIFINHELTDQLIYSDVLMNQSHQIDIYGPVNESLGKYKMIDIIYWDINHTDNDTGDNYTVTYNKTIYYDSDNAEMPCDYVLDDKSCLIVVQGIIGTETRYDYMSLPTLKEKLVINGLKIEQKESGIPLPKSSTIQLIYTVKHPIPYGPDYTDTGASYNKYNITVCSSIDPDECTTLDPEWYNTSWTCYRPIEVNITENVTDYQLFINITNKTNAQNNCADMRFTLEDNVTELNYWIEECDTALDYAHIWVNVSLDTDNGTQIGYWYGNTTAVTSQSNGTETFIGFEDGVTNNLVRTTAGNGLWELISEQRHGNSSATSDGYLMGLHDIPTSYYAEVQVTNTADSSIAGAISILSITDYNEFYSSIPANTVYNPVIRWRVTRNSPTGANANKFAVFYVSTSGTTFRYSDPGWSSSVTSYYGGSGTYTAKSWSDSTTFYADILDSSGNSIFSTAPSVAVSTVKAFTDEYVIDSGEPYNNYFYNGQNFDNYTLRKYISPEPTYSIGAEESLPAELIVYLNAPANNTNTTDHTPSFNFTVNDSESDYSCELFLDNIGYGVNGTTLNDTATIITANASLSSESYDWYVNCTSGAIVNQSDILTVNIIPDFNITLNAPVDNYNTSDNTPDFNFTVNGSENDYSCELFINDTGYGISDSWCYQETANVSTSCGGLDTGTYDFSDGNWVNPEYIYDGSWGTYGYSFNNPKIYGYINYSKPSNAIYGSKIRIRNSHVIGCPTIEKNITLPSACFYEDNIQIRCFSGIGISTYSRGWDCWNSTDWENIDSCEFGYSATAWLYEEAMWWHVNISNDTATIITANDTLADGTYDWYINCTVDSTVNQSDTHSITIDTTYPQIDFVNPTDANNTNVTRNYTYLNWTVTELYQDTMILNWNGSNSTVTDTFINKTGLSEGIYTYYVWVNDTSGNGNQSETRTFTIDITAPAISAYYQWDSANVTVDFGVWTEGFVSVNWNLTDVTGVNTSTCWIQVRNKDTVTGYTNMSYVDDLNHPDYDITTGYKNLTCYTEDLGGDVTRVSANMTRSYDWRPLNTAFDQDSAAHDNIYYSHGGRSTKIVFHNITNTINTTFIFLADVVNQTNTVADHIFYSCNESYVSGDFTTDDNCAIVGAAHPNSTRDVNFDYLIGALMTDENGSFGGVVHTETMYGISYCPSCTNTGNSWITYSTNVYDGHSATSPNQGTTWTNLTGEEFNVILHVIDNTRLEFNLTIDDYLDNQLSDLQTDIYGPLPNLAPFGDITTDNVTGNLVSYHDIHGMTESGTICINVTVSDPNADTMNVSIYLLNNDSTINQTLLLNQSITAYGIICHQWDTTNVSNGDYRLNVTAHDGSLIGYDESAGYIRIDNGRFSITLNSPENYANLTDNTPEYNITVSGSFNTYNCSLFMNTIKQKISMTQENGTAFDTSIPYYYYVNYTTLSAVTPFDQTDSIWYVTHSTPHAYHTPDNYSTDAYSMFYCYDSPYQFRIYAAPGIYTASCWNGTAWDVLGNRTDTSYNLNFESIESSALMYDNNQSTAAVMSATGVQWNRFNATDSYGYGAIYEEYVKWEARNLTFLNDTATTFNISTYVNDGNYYWTMTCISDSYSNTSAEQYITMDSITESEYIYINSYTTSNTAWGFPDGIIDEANTSLMLIKDINFTQLSPTSSATPYAINITEAYITNASNYVVHKVLNSTDGNITYTVTNGRLKFSTEAITGSVIYSIYINITQGAHLETKIQSSGYDTPWTYASVQLDDSITLNVSGSFWVHQALGTASYFDANTQALHVYYDCGDAVMVTGDLFSLGYTPAGYLITKENELDNSYHSVASCMDHPYSVAINMRAYDSASDNIMDKLTYNASFPNHNTTLAKQEFSMAIIADSGIDRSYIESSSSTYEPADTPKSGSGLDSPEDIIEEIKKRFIEERLLLCPTGYFFNHTSNRCEPYISPLAVLEQDIINCTRELFGLITRPVVISVPVYIQEHTLLGPQLVIPSIFFILLFVTALYIYYSKIPPKDIVSRLRKAFKTPRALRPSPAAITPVVGRQKVLRPAR